MAEKFSGGINPHKVEQAELIEAERAMRTELEKPFPMVERVNQAETRVRVAEARLQAVLDGRITRERGAR